MIPSPSQSVLLVDDTPANLRVLFQLLEPENLELRVANRGETALDSLHVKPADLILLDVNMPGIDGFETCRRIQSEPELADIPVIFMTALNSPEDKLKGFELGAVDYITKPFEAQEVLARIRLHLKLRSVSHQLQQKSAQLETFNTQLEKLVTERTQALQASETKFRQIADNLKQVLWVYELSEQAFTYISPAYEDIWGKTNCQDSVTISEWLREVHPDDVAWVTNNIHQAITLGELDHEYRIIRSDGAIRWIHSRAFPIRTESGSLYRLTGITEDITQQKLAEQSILQSLAKEQELSNLKSRFITTTSHEFRTPLAVISSNAELLQLFGDKLDDQERQECLENIMTHVDKAVLLLEDLFLFNDVEINSIQFQPDSIDLSAFWQSLHPYVNSKFSARSFIFSNQDYRHHVIEEKNSIYWDTKIIKQILSIIVDNSTLYSLPSERIELKLDVHANEIKISVKDYGIGISPDDQLHVFKPFHRGLNVETRPGTGMGLAIAKRLTELHQGQIDIKSELNVGTTCTITLPWVVTPKDQHHSSGEYHLEKTSPAQDEMDGMSVPHSDIPSVSRTD